MESRSTTAKFSDENFVFLPGDEIPDHINEQPADDEVRDPKKFHLDGFSRTENEGYRLATNLEDFAAVTIVKAGRQRRLDETQPVEHPGGNDDIQDQTIIRHPTEQPTRSVVNVWQAPEWD